MRLVKKIIWSLVSLLLLVVLVVVGGYVFVRVKYKVDLFNTISQLKTLNESVDENVIAPDAFSELNMSGVKEQTDLSIVGLVTVDDESNYSVNLNSSLGEMQDIIKLNYLQVGALADNILQSQMGGKIKFNNKDIEIKLMQVKFDNVQNGGARFNTVFRLNITPFKDEMKGFPFDFLKKYVPDTLYISSTVDVSKTTTPFEYVITHVSLTINNLDNVKTQDLFHTLDTFLKFGSQETFNETIGNKVMGVLIGNESETGLAYSLKPLGATDYKFVIIDDIEYFTIQK